MTTQTIIFLNVLFAIVAVAAVGGVMRLAHRLPSWWPNHDEQWGGGGNPWIASDPLPLAQVAHHETDRELSRAA